MIEEHYKYEIQAESSGYSMIAGGDEAGRGPWAGSVYAAFVVLDRTCKIEGLDDSKKLTRKKRKELFEIIQDRALTFGIGIATPQEIDELNILEATKLAFKRAFYQLNPEPDYVLLDYIKLPWLQLPHQAFAKGESISASIAAASILAKEARDLYMEKISIIYPQYSFEKHMGYGTAVHLKALEEFGPCDIHRKSFKPIKRLLSDNNLFSEILSK